MTTIQNLLIIILIIAILAVGPLLGIWALNTLFPVLAIPYSLKTWAAALILMAVFQSKVKR